jgi:phosphoribosylformimino-5-aminoimidazole carboxamide ribotide isomerase
MVFTIYPAIDLRGGKCVRLRQGDYAQETVYGDPVQLAQQWEQQGAQWLHLVDLDAARTGELSNLAVIEQIVSALSIPVQVGGGIRNLQRVERLLERGVARLIIGSAALAQPAFVAEALAIYASQLAIGIDAREGKVATHGWLETSEVDAITLAKQMVELGAERFIFTDIARDGMLSGVNLPALRELALATGKDVIASGGMRDLVDITALQKAGMSGVIIGKALYTGDIVLPEALAVAAGEGAI